MLKLEERFKIEKAASTDELRPAMCRISIQGDRLIATDGHILADVPVEREGDADTATELDVELLKAARKASKKDKHLNPGLVTLANLNGTGTLADGSIVPNNVSGENFPNVKAVIPTEGPTFTVGIDVDLLSRLAAALGSSKVRLQFISPKKAIRVTPLGMTCTEALPDENVKGLLMPIRLDN